MSQHRTASRILAGLAVAATVVVGVSTPAQAFDTGWNGTKSVHTDFDTGWNGTGHAPRR